MKIIYEYYLQLLDAKLAERLATDTNPLAWRKVYKETLTTLHTNLVATYQVPKPNMAEVESVLIVTKEVLDCLNRGLPKLPTLETREDVEKMDGGTYRQQAEFKIFVRDCGLELRILLRMIERDPRFVHVKNEVAKLAEELLKEANSM